MLGISTYKLDLHSGHTLLLHDMLYATKIRKYLLSLISLLRLGFCFSFENNGISLYLGTIYYGCGYISYDFMIMDLNDSSVNDYVALMTPSDTMGSIA